VVQIFGQRNLSMRSERSKQESESRLEKCELSCYSEITHRMKLQGSKNVI